MDYNGSTFAARNTFLIDPIGTIRKVYLNSADLGDLPENEVVELLLCSRGL